ncbi:hypothetical protein DFP72DRAFT_846948 [Ephemerocybe angulata]|uniref:Uncharacterized protein n=1 Tax=Ephemerocybe angulata TaxID=980116 RepID=A0A8H6HZY9_9AGAR|nr:hypothetical protein DFP72DRAFT_846948 [Tulosesus angulatus]
MASTLRTVTRMQEDGWTGDDNDAAARGQSYELLVIAEVDWGMRAGRRRAEGRRYELLRLGAFLAQVIYPCRRGMFVDGCSHGLRAFNKASGIVYGIVYGASHFYRAQTDRSARGTVNKRGSSSAPNADTHQLTSRFRFDISRTAQASAESRPAHTVPLAESRLRVLPLPILVTPPHVTYSLLSSPLAIPSLALVTPHEPTHDLGSATARTNARTNARHGRTLTGRRYLVNSFGTTRYVRDMVRIRQAASTSTHRLTHAMEAGSGKTIRRDIVWDDQNPARRNHFYRYIAIPSSKLAYDDADFKPQDPARRIQFYRYFATPKTRKTVQDVHITPKWTSVTRGSSHQQECDFQVSTPTVATYGARPLAPQRRSPDFVLLLLRVPARNGVKQPIETRTSPPSPRTTQDQHTLSLHDIARGNSIRCDFANRSPARASGRHHGINRRFRGLGDGGTALGRVRPIFITNSPPLPPPSPCTTQHRRTKPKRTRAIITVVISRAVGILASTDVQAAWRWGYEAGTVLSNPAVGIRIISIANSPPLPPPLPRTTQHQYALTQRGLSRGNSIRCGFANGVAAEAFFGPFASTIALPARALCAKSHATQAHARNHRRTAQTKLRGRDAVPGFSRAPQSIRTSPSGLHFLLSGVAATCYHKSSSSEVHISTSQAIGNHTKCQCTVIQILLSPDHHFATAGELYYVCGTSFPVSWVRESGNRGGRGAEAGSTLSTVESVVLFGLDIAKYTLPSIIFLESLEWGLLSNDLEESESEERAWDNTWRGWMGFVYKRWEKGVEVSIIPFPPIPSFPHKLSLPFAAQIYLYTFFYTRRPLYNLYVPPSLSTTSSSHVPPPPPKFLILVVVACTVVVVRDFLSPDRFLHLVLTVCSSARRRRRRHPTLRQEDRRRHQDDFAGKPLVLSVFEDSTTALQEPSRTKVHLLKAVPTIKVSPPPTHLHTITTSGIAGIRERRRERDWPSIDHRHLIGTSSSKRRSRRQRRAAPRMVGQGARLSRMFMVMGAEVMSRRACEWGALFLGSRRCMTDIDSKAGPSWWDEAIVRSSLINPGAIQDSPWAFNRADPNLQPIRLRTPRPPRARVLARPLSEESYKSKTGAHSTAAVPHAHQLSRACDRASTVWGSVRLEDIEGSRVWPGSSRAGVRARRGNRDVRMHWSLTRDGGAGVARRIGCKSHSGVGVDREGSCAFGESGQAWCALTESTAGSVYSGDAGDSESLGDVLPSPFKTEKDILLESEDSGPVLQCSCVVHSPVDYPRIVLRDPWVHEHDCPFLSRPGTDASSDVGPLDSDW